MNMLKWGAALGVVLLAGCGGGSEVDPTSKSPSVAYATPTPVGGQPSIVLNSALSSSTVLVFDVVGSSATSLVRGVTLNLQVDSSKLLPVEVPGAAGATIRPSTTPGVQTAGWGGGQSVVYRKDRADGLCMMVNALRLPAPPAAANGPMMRFAYKINGTPVSGVIRADVASGSGLVDGNGQLIPGTAPVIGRLEYQAGK